MSRYVGHWNDTAIIERLGAEQAVAAVPRKRIADRARLRLRLARTRYDVDSGVVEAGVAAELFRAISREAANSLIDDSPAAAQV